jgi:hypothetical protein
MVILPLLVCVTGGCGNVMITVLAVVTGSVYQLALRLSIIIMV